MRLETVLFDSVSSYGRMAKVLARTVAKHSPETPLTIHTKKGYDSELTRIACSYVWNKTSYLDNARKTKYHHDIIQEARNGDEICLIDCDTFVLRPLDALGRMDFDIAVTTRVRTRYPVNTGVVFVRVSEQTKHWYIRWYEMVRELMRNKVLIMKTHPKYGGINQCALGLLREQTHALSIRSLDCKEWNLTSDLYHEFNPDVTRIVHIQGQLRQRIIHKSPVGNHKVVQMEKMWRSYETESSTART